jgi:hypothetical protein
LFVSISRSGSLFFFFVFIAASASPLHCIPLGVESALASHLRAPASLVIRRHRRCLSV